MSCNIFDVVLHPSLFQQQHDPHRRSQSAPVSGRGSTVASGCVPSSQHTFQTTNIPGHERGHGQWGDDEWAEVRKRKSNSGSHNDDRRFSSGKRRQKQQRQPRPKRGRRSIEPDDDLPTLLDIFQFLDSPDPAPYLDVCMSSEYSDIFEACLGDGKYEGMRTQLYSYQKNSLFKMLKRELLPDFFLDPNYSPLRNTEPGVAEDLRDGGRRLQHPLLPYFQFAHRFNDASNPWLYTRSSEAGGNAVRAQDVSWYSDTRGGIICEDMGTGKTCECLALVLLTKRQMAHPPAKGDSLPCVGTVASALATDLGGSRGNNADDSVHSLKTIAARAALLSCAESLRVMHDDGLVADAMWKQLAPYPPYYWVNPIGEDDNRPRRGAGNYSAQQVSFKVYMSSSTIVVVPDNLIDQWVREKYKHVEDARGLEVLKIDSNTLAVPEPTQLIQYDVVLISVSRLSKEYVPIDTNISGLWHQCRCYSRGLEQCACDRRMEAATLRSPLLRVHWKRIIVDEGHIMSSRNATRSLIAAHLIADRRWVCTGTPTHNLVHATSEISTDCLGDPAVQAESSDSVAAGECSQGIGCDGSADRSPTTAHSRPRRRYRVGQRESSGDFFQLGMLMSKFLRVAPFSQSTARWTSIMVQPYKRDEPGARDRLRALMQNIMVRNRAESVGSEVQLPPLHEKMVTLAPSRLQKLTYNTVVAFFHINAVLTERSGRDYFFHPDNKKHLRQVVENLFLACFWFSASLDHIRDGIDNGRRAIELWSQGKKPAYTDADVALLRRCIAELQRAFDDAEWMHTMQAASVTYRVDGLPARMRAEGFFAPAGESQPSDGILLMTSDQIADISARTKSMLATDDDDLPPRTSNLTPCEFEMLGSATISACTSSKVAYIVNSVSQYQGDEKCIVFVSGQSEAAIISEALTVARVRHLVYASHGMSSQSQRRNNITTFSTSVMYNTIVMDVHLAAYGIDLSAASRVWFVSPVWQAARERQAIKRAHRLGQHRPVFVETLLTAGSIEQALWSRRQELLSNDGDGYGDTQHVVSGGVEDDGKMRSMLSNARFIETNISNHANGLPVLFSSPIPVLLPSSVRYPQLLMRKYHMWRPGSPLGPTRQVPFFKTRRLVLHLPLDVVATADQAEPSEPSEPTNQLTH
ncbi:hypothetical protein IWW48_002572 [Coemansia sp. RSA 1200]|nr:hypothetical protein IWW48_002572 [Coemansia sp. RSA 1200]